MVEDMLHFIDLKKNIDMIMCSGILFEIQEAVILANKTIPIKKDNYLLKDVSENMLLFKPIKNIKITETGIRPVKEYELEWEPLFNVNYISFIVRNKKGRWYMTLYIRYLISHVIYIEWLASIMKEIMDEMKRAKTTEIISDMLFTRYIYDNDFFTNLK